MDTKEKFLRDIEHHQIEVIKDDGVHRHIRLRRPGTMCMHFDLITWPGYLCYTGDMGTYVFSRLSDMFEFFRTDRKQPSDELHINLGYWSEKLQAVEGGRMGGAAKKFSSEEFERVVKEYLVRWMRTDGLSRAGRRELREAVQERVLSHAEDYSDGSGAYVAANDFHEKIEGKEFYFIDFWEHDLTDYTFRFVWCCYAIAWGIAQYDKAHTPVAQAA